MGVATPFLALVRLLAPVCLLGIGGFATADAQNAAPSRSPLMMMPIELTDQERQDLIAFMETLTDAANPVLRR